MNKKSYPTTIKSISVEVNSLIDTIIKKNVFSTSSGALVKKSGAQLTAKNVTKLDIA